MGVELGTQLVEREPRGIGLREHFGDEGAQPSFVLARRPRLGRSRRHERADTPTRLKHAGPLEVRVDARDGVGVDPQVHRQLSDRRQLVAGTQPSGGHGGPQAALELRVDGGSIAKVDGDDSHLIDYTNSLVQWRQQAFTVRRNGRGVDSANPVQVG